MSHHIFLSHESSSLPFVEKLADMFESNGVTCWYAPRDLDKSSAGKEYDDEIVDAIGASEALVVVLNDEALGSRWVKREVSQAEKQGKMIFPFVIEELTINNGLLMRLEDRHLINAYPDASVKFPILLKNVKELLGQQTSDNNTTSFKDKEESKTLKKKNDFDFSYDEGMAFLEAEEEQSAFLAFLQSAENGSEAACQQLFKIISLHSNDKSFLDEETWEHIEELSDEGRAFADLLMHYRYYAFGTQHEIALKYLKRAIEKQVSPYAFLQLGICYGWGLGVNSNDVLERLYYQKAWESGCDYASSFLGQLYLNGRKKIKKDLQKAEEILLAGIAKGVGRSYNKLVDLYREQNRQDKVLETIQRMIDNKIKGGYTLMADYYNCLGSEEERDDNKALEYYIKAINNNEKEAWGGLAIFYWNNYDTEEAFQTAEKGCFENDSLSLGMLGYFYENDPENPDYSKAWKCYEERNQRFGINASNMANLYLTYDYLPDDYSLKELKRILEIDIKLQQGESATALIQVILKEKGRNTDISYENLVQFPEVYDYLKSASEISDQNGNISEIKYIYGRLLIEKSGKLHNPYKGINLVEEAAENGSAKALEYGFEYYIQKDPSHLKKLSVASIRNNLFPNKYINLIIEKGRPLVLKEEFLDWLNYGLDTLTPGIQNLKTRLHLYKNKFDILRKDNLPLEEANLIKLKEELENNRKIVKEGAYLRYFKEYLSELYSDFDREKLLRGEIKDPKNFNILLLTLWDFDNFDILSEINFEEKLYEIVVQDIEFNKLMENLPDDYNSDGDNDFTKSFNLRRAYFNLTSAYRSLVEDNKITELEEDLLLKKQEFVPYVKIDTIFRYIELALKILIHSRNIYGEIWEEIINKFDNPEELCEIALKIEDTDATLLLISYIELILEAQIIIAENLTLRNAYVEKDFKYIKKELDKYTEKLKSFGFQPRQLSYEELQKV